MTWLPRAVGLMLALVASAAFSEGIVAGRYEHSVDRYGHFAPGPAHEYSTLTATTTSGREVELVLPVDEVFEDVVPRPVRVGAAAADARLLVIVSRRSDGSRLALVGLHDDRAVVVAQSAPTGAPKRWLNPVGVGDLDGDGEIEIAAVTTPHIGGSLRIYRVRGDRLVEAASLGGFSNHMFGSSELGLSTIARVDGALRLIVPDTARRSLRIVAFANERLTEVRRCKLDGVVIGPVSFAPPETITVEVDSGRRSFSLMNCST